MPKLNKRTEEKIKEQILGYLYENYPLSYPAYKIAAEIARNDEFVARMLSELERQRLVNKSKKYTQWNSYRLSEESKLAYDEKVYGK